MTTILLTGAAGGMGRLLRPRLARSDRVLRLLDLAPITAGPREEAVTASVTDLPAMIGACDGVDAIIHLGGISGEAPWEELLDVNINGTYTVFEAARQAGVGRVVFASSNHAVGFHTPDEYPLPEACVPLPDTFYGVSKVAGEALGALYANRCGMDVISVRILSCFLEPIDPRALSTWFSPDDCARLFEACLAAESPGYRVVYGVSGNSRGGWVSLDGARALGFEPRDDAERFAELVIAEHGEPRSDDRLFAHLGGAFCFPESGLRPRSGRAQAPTDSRSGRIDKLGTGTP